MLKTEAVPEGDVENRGGRPRPYPREMVKTEAVGRGFQHLPRDLGYVNVLENNV